METKQQIDHLIELAIVQRAELKRLVEQLPVLRTYLLEQINATIEDMEPQLRSDLIEFCDEKTDGKIKEIRSFFSEAKSEFATKSEAFFVELENGVQARYAQLAQERALALDFADDARKGLEAAAQQEAAKIPGQVSELVKQELARFPRAGELDQLRKEFSEPRGLNPRGKWKSTETYQKLDLVAYNGDSYVSNVNDNREKPSRSSVSWTLSAARGQGSGGGGISSLNDILGAPTSDFNVVGAEGSNYVRKTLTAGTNVTLEETPTTITINAGGGSGTTAQIVTATVVNAEAVAITRGQVVYAYAATGNLVSVKLAYNTSDATSAKTFGIVSDDSIAAGATGTVTCVGVVDKLALGTYSEGDTVYLSATPGAFTATKPYAPNHLVYVGIVERANNGNGELYVKIQNGYELDEIHDVQITSAPAAGAVLIRDATNSLWKAATITGTSGQVTVTNADASTTLSLPTAITNVNSLTAQSATNLTLNGGSSGASIVAGQGTNANITLTPSGTGSIVNGAATFSVTQGGYLKAGSSTARVVIGPSGGTGTIAAYDGSGVITLSYNGSNLLLGTATDSSNGKLQLATHTTTTGGIGFGTDTSLYRTQSGTLAINDASTAAPQISFRDAGTQKGSIYWYSSQFVIGSRDAASSTILVSGNGTLALTLDSGQNATFAGNVIASRATGSATITPATIQIRTTTNAGDWSTTSNWGNLDFWSEDTSGPGNTTRARIGARAFGTTGAQTSLYFSTSDAAGGLLDRMVIGHNGNILLGTTTDSGNGIIQLATHNTIAGGIGFGTDVSLIRAGAGNLQILSGSTTGAKLTLYAPDSTSANTLSWAHPGSRFWDLGTVAGSVATLKLTVTSASSATFSIDPNVSIAATTASSSTTSGALIVSGGVGVAGAINAGGNLTVSGTGTSTIAGTLSVNGITGLGKLNVRVETNGNLHCRPYSLLNGSGVGVALDSLNDLGSGVNGLYIRGNPIKLAFGNVIVVDGNTLLGTTTDSSNGKLQLATHTTSAGGIGFGTDVSLYRSGSNALSLNSGGSTNFFFRNNGSPIGYIVAGGTNFQLTATASLVLQTNNGTTALTLDTSQNATFAGNVDSSSANYNIRSTAAGGNVYIKSNGGALNLNNTVGNGDIVLGYSTSLINFKGSLRLNNAYVATPQVTTGYVTIQDSTGTTYKVLVAA